MRRRSWVQTGMAAGVLWCVGVAAGAEARVSGELKAWHKVTLTFEGPAASETGSPNPFMDYRLEVAFRQGEKQYVAPGYWAADGDAANTSATAGNAWRVHFAPDAPGKWEYEASFRRGPGVAVSEGPGAGQSGGFMDGEKGSFEVGPTDKGGRDWRGKGMLRYVGKRYLQFAGTGEYFVKCGADAPENFLAYADFDGDFAKDGHKDELVKTWGPHVQDWRAGDPTWQGDKGKGMIGALNYLASKGMNAFSFLTMNINGDDQNVFPYLTYEERERLDVSRLAQWEAVFEHADKLGLYLHFKTQETENECLLDGGEVGPQRRLYYRELIARFGHHLALNWNLGEENGFWADKKEFQSTAQRLAMAQYFYDHDPYHHNVVIHNGQAFDDLLAAGSKYTGLSLQYGKSGIHGPVREWVGKTEGAGFRWVIANDEQGPADDGLLPDAEDGAHDVERVQTLWGCLLAGGAGCEFYFGYKHAHSDLTCQDWRSRDKFWDMGRAALEFWGKNGLAFVEMRCEDGLTGAGNFCFAKAGEAYVVCLTQGGTAELDLGASTGAFEVGWYNPRRGGALQAGSVGRVRGPGKVSLGTAPGEGEKDWVILVRGGAAAAEVKIFEEVDGLAAVEAEDFIAQEKTEKRQWYVVTRERSAGVAPDADPSHAETASGGAYVEILPDTRQSEKDKLTAGENFSETPGLMAVASYAVHFNTVGRYYVWVRAFSTGGEDNGLHVGIDGTWPESGQRMQWCEGKGAWQWESKQRTEQEHCGEPYKIYLDVKERGLHVISFSMREDGFECDKWLMTRERDFVRPGGAGPAPRRQQVAAGSASGSGQAR